MSRGKVVSGPVLDATLLSTSAIGSPAAFSTAIKPPGSFSTHPSGGDFSLLLEHRPQELSRLGDSITDETSLGILDLDNIHESSMSVFLTSPRTTQDLVGSQLPSSSSRPFTSASQSLPSPPPSMGPLRISGATTVPAGGSRLVEQEEREEGEGEVGLPEDLLEVSGSVGYGSEGETQSEGDGGDRESPMELDGEEEISAVVSVAVPHYTTQAGDSRENESLDQGPPQSEPTTNSLLSGQLSLREEGGDGGGFSVSQILQAARERGEEMRSSHLFLGPANSLITEQEEPSVMYRAAELSRFEPHNLTSVADREGLLGMPHPLLGLRAPGVIPNATVTVGGASNATVSEVGTYTVGGDWKTENEQDISDLTAGTISPEGLPSAYLHQSSPSPHSSASQTPSHTVSHSPSLSPPLSHTQTSLPSGSLAGLAAGEGGESPYSPFDSEEPAVDMGEEEFGQALDSESFLDQLKADEAALQEANKLLLPEGFVAPTPQTPSFTPGTSLPMEIAGSGEKELSIGAYFAQRSGNMGGLDGSGVLSSTERPQFSSPLQSSLPTPLGETNPPPHTSVSPEVSPEHGDTTLVAAEDEEIGEDPPISTTSPPTAPLQSAHHTLQGHTLPDGVGADGGKSTNFSVQLKPSVAQSQQPPPPRTISTSAAQVVVSTTSAAVSTYERPVLGGAGEAMVTHPLVSRTANLTPVVTVHTPFPMQYQIPKLDLSGLSKTVNSTPASTTVSTLTHSHSLSAVSIHQHTSSHPHTQPILPTVSNIHSPPSAATPTSGMGTGHQQSGMDSGLSGMEQRLASQYLRSTSGTSTLMFPELSATYLSLPPSEPGSTSMPTPSLAHFTGGFNTTTSGDVSFLESLLGPLPPSSSDDISSLDTSSKFHNRLKHTTSVGETAEAELAHTQSVSSQESTTTTTHSSSGLAVSPTTAASSKSPRAPGIVEKSGTQSSPRDTLKTAQKDRDGAKTKRTHLSSPPASSPTRLSQSPPSKQQSNPSSAPSLTPARAAVEGGVRGGGRGKQRPLSPRTETARKKVSQLKTALDSTEFDASAFLSRLEEERSLSVSKSPPSSVASTTSATLSGTRSQDLDLPTVSSGSGQLLGGQNSSTVVSESTTVDIGTTTVVSQTPTIATTVVSQTAAVASKTTTLAGVPTVVSHQTPTFAGISTTVVSQPTTVVSQPTTVVNQPTTVVSSTVTSGTPPTTTVATDIQYLSPTKPSIDTLALQTSTADTSVSSSSDQSDSGTPVKPGERRSPERRIPRDHKRGAVLRDSGTPVKPGERRSPERRIPRDHKRGAVLRDIGVGTTPGLHKTQPRSSSSSHKRLDESLVNSTHSRSPPDTSHTVTPHQTPISTLPSAISSPKNTPSLSSSQPIYTSPRLHPHTSLSPPPQPRPQPRPSPTRERRKTPQPNSLEVPDSLCFRSPCCVGVTLSDHLQLTNLGDRWLQLSFKLSELYCNGASDADHSTFSAPQRCFVSPRKTESIKVSFSPKRAGTYEALLVCKARLVVSSETENSNFLLEKVVVKALAVPPILDVSTSSLSPSSGEPCLDYGLMVAGTAISLPLCLTNRGSSELPLRLAISAPTLSQLYFSFDDPPPSLKSLSPSSHLTSRPFSTTLVLPPKPKGRDAKPDTHSVDVNFKSPKSFSDGATPLGPPEEIRAQLNISVEGPNSSGVLCSVPVRATVGVARLHVPRSLQALSVTCREGQAATREVPFKNAGNIPLQVAFEFSADCKHFEVSPEFLELSPSEEARVSVSFSPSSSPLVEDGFLMVHIRPHGPSYELKLQGTASERETAENTVENLLFCNKRCLYWGAVDAGGTAEQTLLLQNSFTHSVSLQFSLRHRDRGFQLATAESLVQEHRSELAEHSQMQLNLAFSPQSVTVFRNALDIFDAVHSKKFRIPLCGYGGSSRVEVISARHSTTGAGLWVDMGPVTTKKKSSVKISIYNSGSRAGFVKAVCTSLDRGVDISPLSSTHASIVPSECVLQPQQMQELTLTYQPLSREEVVKCAESVSPLARLVLVHGDEIMRQRFRQFLAGNGPGEEEGEEREGKRKLDNKFNENFLRDYPGQEAVVSDPDFSQFDVENEELFFEQHLRQIEVTLCGIAATDRPIKTSGKTHTLSTSFESPPKSLRPPSPPHTHTGTSPPLHTSTAVRPACKITSSLTLVLPDTISGQRSEKALEIHNPYSQPLNWKLASVASAFIRDSVGEIQKANYSVFLATEKRGSVTPHSTTQVLVVFQPHNVGSFSQIWDLQVSCSEIESGVKKIRLSFGGKALSRAERDAAVTPRVRFVSPPPPQPPSPIPHTLATSHPHTLTTKRAVYIKEESTQFPQTQVGGRAVLKVKVCNRGKLQHQFRVVSLSHPFSVDHQSFLLGSRQCARLPVHFSPTRPGVFEAVLAVRTDAGHQAFSQLTGTATEDD